MCRRIALVAAARRGQSLNWKIKIKKRKEKQFNETSF